MLKPTEADQQEGGDWETGRLGDWKSGGLDLGSEELLVCSCHPGYLLRYRDCLQILDPATGRGRGRGQPVWAGLASMGGASV